MQDVNTQIFSRTNSHTKKHHNKATEKQLIKKSGNKSVMRYNQFKIKKKEENFSQQKKKTSKNNLTCKVQV